MQALERLGHPVRGVDTVNPWREAAWWKRQVQRRLQQGSVVAGINRLVLEAAREFKPDLVWAEKQEFLTLGTLQKLRPLGCRLVHFTPDPYFSLPWKRTRLMDEALPAFDVLIYCKSYEKADYAAAGNLSLYMPLGYCEEAHHPLPSPDPGWSSGVGFLGGWEPRRERLLHAIASTGAELKIWGGYWEFLRDGKRTLRRQIILRQLAGSEPFRFHRDEMLAATLQGGEVYGDDYARALTGAKIGVGFLRTVCPDQHTTRTFEIPACGSMLLADRTEEHQEFFSEGTEAEFFASEEELLSKIDFYRANEKAREKMAEAGRRRCEASGYSYKARVAKVLEEIKREF